MEIKKKDRLIDTLIFISCFVLLCYIYGRNINKVSTVWELGDEAGYLSNTAFFLGYNWDSVRAVLPYFGYGYSLILVPSFIFSDNGIQLVQGACFTNLLCILGIFVCLNILGKKLLGSCNRKILYYTSFMICLMPYLSTNIYKVVCEVFLSLWYLIMALVLYWCLKKNKTYCYICLGLVTTFIFFIHTRAIVVVAVMILVVLMANILSKRVSLKSLVGMAISMIVLFVILYAIKHSIISSKYEIVENIQEISTNNLITIDYIKERIFWLLHKDNIEIYFLSFMAKVFYIIVASGGIIIWGIKDLVSDIINEREKILINRGTETEFTKLFLLLSAVFMIIICTINGAGMSENFTYFFYSRYYEYVIIPIVFLALNSLVNKDFKYKTSVVLTIVALLAGMFTANIQKYLHSNEIHMDTSRIPSFSLAIKHCNSYKELIYFLTIICCISGVMYILIRNNKITKFLILFFISCMLLATSNTNLDMIFTVNDKALKDSEIALYISEQENVKKIYMLDEDYVYDYFYSRMQVLVKDKKIEVIDPLKYEDIEQGSYILRYSNVEENETIDCKLLMEGNAFNLYQR